MFTTQLYTFCNNNNKKYKYWLYNNRCCCNIKETDLGVIMTTTSQSVKNILSRKVFFREAIDQKIISYNLLAKQIKPEVEAELGKTVKLSAIIMALRRQSDNLKKSSKRPTFSYFIETIKTDICYTVFEESPTLLNKIQNLYSVVDFKKGGILNITQGNYEVAIITNAKYKETLLDLFFDEKILDAVDNLISLSLTYSKEFLFTPGTLYDILRFVAWENINVIDVILTQTELSLIIDQKDLMRSYKAVGRFAENSNKNEINGLDAN